MVTPPIAHQSSRRCCVRSSYVELCITTDSTTTTTTEKEAQEMLSQDKRVALDVAKPCNHPVGVQLSLLTHIDEHVLIICRSTHHRSWLWRFEGGCSPSQRFCCRWVLTSTPPAPGIIPLVIVNHPRLDIRAPSLLFDAASTLTLALLFFLHLLSDHTSLPLLISLLSCFSLYVSLTIPTYIHTITLLLWISSSRLKHTTVAKQRFTMRVQRVIFKWLTLHSDMEPKSTLSTRTTTVP